MNSYEDFLKDKSLDELLREAKKEDIKKEMALAKVEEKEGTRVYDNCLVTIIGEDLAPQEHEMFLGIMQKIFDVENLFYARGNFSSVSKSLVRLYNLLKFVEFPKKLYEFVRDIRSKFVELGRDYLKSLEHSSDEPLVAGSRVGTIFVPFSETKLSDLRKYYKTSNGSRDWDPDENGVYFGERNVSFPPGSLGKIIGFSTNRLIVQFDKEGEWSKDWSPDCDYWGEKKNAALYEHKELRILPFSVVEICALKTLLDKVDDRLDKAIG